MDNTILILIFAAIFVFELPITIAFWRQHPSRWAIFFTHLFFGWTGVGWVICLIWSCTGIQRTQIVTQQVVVQGTLNAPAQVRPI